MYYTYYFSPWERKRTLYLYVCSAASAIMENSILPNVCKHDGVVFSAYVSNLLNTVLYFAKTEITTAFYIYNADRALLYESIVCVARNTSWI